MTRPVMILKFVTNVVFYHTRTYDFTILRLSYLLAYLETAASPRGQTPNKKFSYNSTLN